MLNNIIQEHFYHIHCILYRSPFIINTVYYTGALQHIHCQYYTLYRSPFRRGLPPWTNCICQLNQDGQPRQVINILYGQVMNIKSGQPGQVINIYDGQPGPSDSLWRFACGNVFWTSPSYSDTRMTLSRSRVSEVVATYPRDDSFKVDTITIKWVRFFLIRAR